MTDVENLKKVKAVINDLPRYMDYLPTEEQNEAFDVVLKLLNEAIEKATVLCKDCKHYIQTDPEWHCGQCKYHINGTFAADTCDQGERKEDNEDLGNNPI